MDEQSRGGEGVSQLYAPAHSGNGASWHPRMYLVCLCVSKSTGEQSAKTVYAMQQRDGIRRLPDIPSHTCYCVCLHVCACARVCVCVCVCVVLARLQDDGTTWLPVYKTGVRRDNLNPSW